MKIKYLGNIFHRTIIEVTESERDAYRLGMWFGIIYGIYFVLIISYAILIWLLLTKYT